MRRVRYRRNKLVGGVAGVIIGFGILCFLFPVYVFGTIVLTIIGWGLIGALCCSD